MRKKGKKHRSSRVFLAGILSLAMVLSPLSVCASETAADDADAAGGGTGTISEQDIIDNDYVLYLVNCGTPDSSTVPDGYTLGMYQSNVWQQYGADETTGYSWGYAEDTEYSIIETGGSDATSLTDNYIYMGTSVTRVDGKTGFTFTFDLPDRESGSTRYEVVVGVQNPWDTRSLTVNLEGKEAGEMTLTKGSLVEQTYTVDVEDGELNVFLNNPGNTSQYADPVLSYIIVKAAVVADTSSLQALIDKYEAAIAESEKAGNSYTEATMTIYEAARDQAQDLVNDGTATATEIQNAMDILTDAYEALVTIYNYTSITGTNGDVLYDNNGVAIQAHGGQIVKWGDTYYWYGEDKSNDYRPVVGVHLYTSTDLYNWTDNGVVLQSMPVADDEYEADIADVADTDVTSSMDAIFGEDRVTDYYYDLYYEAYKDMDSEYEMYNTNEKYSGKLVETFWNLAEDRCVIERPKVLYNEATGKYVMWFHSDGRTPESTADYGKAMAGVAISDSPNGPFQLLGTYILAYDEDAHDYDGNWDSEGGHVRDMTVFQDDDGTAYVLYSSEGNAVMYIAQLNDSYTGLVKNAEDMVLYEDFNIISTNSREAPAIFKENGYYYVITSGTNGWNPTQSQYSMATDLMGEWTAMGDPFVDDGSGENYSSYSFGSQATYVIDMGDGSYIYMGDRWYATSAQSAYYYIGNLRESRYIWLPIEFGANNTISISNYSDWTLDVLKNLGAITINTDLPESASSLEALAEALPDTLNVTIGDTTYENAAVTWSYDDDLALGDITVTGTLTDIGRSFTISVLLYSDSLIYFADCATGDETGITSDAYDLLSGYSTVIRNTVSDQAYGDDYGYSWGYTSTTGASVGSSSQDMGSKDNGGDFYDCGWWATSSGTITYQFEVDPGNYTVVTGYAEWWSTTRYIKVTVSAVDVNGNETELNSSTFTLSSSGTGMQVLTSVTVPEDAVAISVNVDKTSGNDAVLSWLGVISTDEAAPGYSDDLLVNGSFENDLDSWSVSGTAGTSIVTSDDAPDGSAYCAQNGSTTGWGTGINQTIEVEPNTTYILTGSAMVTGSSSEYWVGANVDGREIYAVFASSDSYTDTTDTSSKLAYAVYSGATEWKDFEVVFTTGDSTETISVYTWINSGSVGYLDNLSLVAVEESSLDWTYFDSVVESAKALNKEDYTAETWTAVAEALSAAETFKANATSDTTRKEMLTYAAALEDAMDALIGVNDPLGGDVYYVDAVNGSDDNDGLTPDTAWKTLTKASTVRWQNVGGSILLKAGCTWNGEQLEVEGATGTVDDSIIIGSYYVDDDGNAVVGVPEGGSKPVINGNGGNWDYSTMADLAAVHIKNCENIVIENLEITNWDSTVGEPGSYEQSSKLLSGLVVENCDAGELDNTMIRNNTIHDVNGLMAGGSGKAAGGLIVVVTGSGTNHTGTVESRYNGLTIESNEVYDVCHEAIYMESVWASRTLVGGTSSDTSYQNAGNSSWIGSSDVLIQNNYVHDVAGDGIVPINTTDCLVQYNLIDNSADSNWDYSNNPNHAALWTWDSDNVTFCYNEASNTSRSSYGSAVGNDSMAFDFDYGVQNCTYEYNYSHDNLGGFLMLCPGPGATVNNIARYNLSVNDGHYSGAPIIRLGTGKYGSIGVQIYNNTAYWEGNGGYSLSLASDSAWEGSVIQDVSVFNNIFYGPVTSGSISTKDGVTYSNNLVYSTDRSAQAVYEEDADDENAIYADPKFTDVTDYTSGSWADGVTMLGTAEGFMITADSPAIDAGSDHPEAPNYSTTSIEDELVENTTEKATEDYYGVELTDGNIDIGASEYAAKSEQEVGDKTELQELYDEYKDTDGTQYTTDSYAELTAALSGALTVLNNEDATQDEVDAAYAALAEAINALTVDSGSGSGDSGDDTSDADASRTKLQTLYDASESIAQGSYTDSSYEAFTTALSNAAAVLANEDATADELTAAYDALVEAINGLTVDTSSASSSSSGSSSTGSSTSTSASAKTGDNSPITMYFIIVIIAAAAIAAVFAGRRRSIQ